MYDQIHLNIADLHILIRSSHIQLLPGHERAYLPFEVKNSKGKLSADIEVDLLMDEPPQTLGWTRIFEDDESWTVYRRENEYLLCYIPTMHGVEPLWVARLYENFSRAVVYCSERMILQTNGRTGMLNPVRYPLDQFLMMYHLSKAQGALIHAAGWRFDGRGFLFPGKSGAGKSTLSRLFSGKEGWQGLSDDRILVRMMEQGIQCFGTPWPGEEGIAMNSGAHLSGIFFLSHHGNNEIRRLSLGEATKWLMPVISIPWYDQETCLRIMKICEDLLLQIPAYELCFEPTHEIIDILEDLIHSEKVMEMQSRKVGNIAER